MVPLKLASTSMVLSCTFAYSSSGWCLTLSSSMNSPASSKYTSSVKNSFWSKLQTKRRKTPLMRAVAMPMPMEVKVAATCSPPCLQGAAVRALREGNSVAVMGQASVAEEQQYEAATTALMSPPQRPGMACRLWTPQVSQRPIFFSRQGVRYWKPSVETMPMRKPMASEPAGWKMIPAVAPMATPPARVAFRICYMVNLSLRAALVMKVDRQLPVSERMVLAMICVLVKGVGAAAPKLKDGQYIHRNSVPISPNRFEKQLVPGLELGLTMALRMRLLARPEQAPKAWMVILPPTSKAWILLRQMTSLRVQPTSWTRHMMSVSSGPTRPMTTPRVMNMDAAEQSASVKLSSLMQMQQLSALKPSLITRFQKADTSRYSCTMTAFMKKVQETADHEKDFEKAIRKPNPISIITFTSWQAGQRSTLRVEFGFAGLSRRTNTPQRMMIATSVIVRRTTKPFRLRVWCSGPPFSMVTAINYKCRWQILIERATTPRGS